VIFALENMDIRKNGPSSNSNRAFSMKDLREELKEVEEQIAAHEKIAATFEDVIKKTPTEGRAPEGLELFSPVNLYGMTQALIASLKIKRIEILRQLDTREKLQYRLEEALKNENYELSAELRDQISLLTDEL